MTEDQKPEEKVDEPVEEKKDEGPLSIVRGFL